MNLDILLTNKYSRKRLKLLKKSAYKTREMTAEEMLTKGLHLIAFAHSNHFKMKDA